MDGADFTQLPMQKWCIGDIISFSHHLARFTSELARLFRAYGEGSGLEPIALKAAMVMPALLLQKPHSSSKAREHVVCLR